MYKVNNYYKFKGVKYKFKKLDEQYIYDRSIYGI